MATKSVWEIIRKRYPESQYALLEEVSDAAGFQRSRSADYITIGLWPSRGLHVNGIELKSFRSDWLNELKNPKKAENIFQYCDYFWLLTTDDTIAKLEEIPEAWGWLCIKGEKIYVKKEAPKHDPKPISRSFLSSMFKRAVDKSGYIRREEVQDEIQRSRQEGKNEGAGLREVIQRDLSELEKNVVDFETASGINIKAHRWFGGSAKVGAAVKFIEEGGSDSVMKQLLRLKETADAIQESINNGLKSLEIEKDKNI